MDNDKKTTVPEVSAQEQSKDKIIINVGKTTVSMSADKIICEVHK